jgi:hypothetical protein
MRAVVFLALSVAVSALSVAHPYHLSAGQHRLLELEREVLDFDDIPFPSVVRLAHLSQRLQGNALDSLDLETTTGALPQSTLFEEGYYKTAFANIVHNAKVAGKEDEVDGMTKVRTALANRATKEFVEQFTPHYDRARRCLNCINQDQLNQAQGAIKRMAEGPVITIGEAVDSFYDLLKCAKDPAFKMDNKLDETQREVSIDAMTKLLTDRIAGASADQKLKDRIWQMVAAIAGSSDGNEFVSACEYVLPFLNEAKKGFNLGETTMDYKTFEDRFKKKNFGGDAKVGAPMLYSLALMSRYSDPASAPGGGNVAEFPLDECEASFAVKLLDHEAAVHEWDLSSYFSTEIGGFRFTSPLPVHMRSGKYPHELGYPSFRSVMKVINYGNLAWTESGHTFDISKFFPKDQSADEDTVLFAKSLFAAIDKSKDGKVTAEEVAEFMKSLCFKGVDDKNRLSVAEQIVNDFYTAGKTEMTEAEFLKGMVSGSQAVLVHFVSVEDLGNGVKKLLKDSSSDGKTLNSQELFDRYMLLLWEFAKQATTGKVGDKGFPEFVEEKIAKPSKKHVVGSAPRKPTTSTGCDAPSVKAVLESSGVSVSPVPSGFADGLRKGTTKDATCPDGTKITVTCFADENKEVKPVAPKCPSKKTTTVKGGGTSFGGRSATSMGCDALSVKAVLESSGVSVSPSVPSEFANGLRKGTAKEATCPDGKKITVTCYADEKKEVKPVATQTCHAKKVTPERSLPKGGGGSSTSHKTLKQCDAVNVKTVLQGAGVKVDPLPTGFADGITVKSSKEATCPDGNTVITITCKDNGDGKIGATASGSCPKHKSTSGGTGARDTNKGSSPLNCRKEFVFDKLVELGANRDDAAKVSTSDLKNGASVKVECAPPKTGHAELKCHNPNEERRPIVVSTCTSPSTPTLSVCSIRDVKAALKASGVDTTPSSIPSTGLAKGTPVEVPCPDSSTKKVTVECKDTLAGGAVAPIVVDTCSIPLRARVSGNSCSKTVVAGALASAPTIKETAKSIGDKMEEEFTCFKSVQVGSKRVNGKVKVRCAGGTATAVHNCGDPSKALPAFAPDPVVELCTLEDVLKQLHGTDGDVSTSFYKDALKIENNFLYSGRNLVDGEDLMLPCHHPYTGNVNIQCRLAKKSVKVGKTTKDLSTAVTGSCHIKPALDGCKEKVLKTTLLYSLKTCHTRKPLPENGCPHRLATTRCGRENKHTGQTGGDVSQTCKMADDKSGCKWHNINKEAHTYPITPKCHDMVTSDPTAIEQTHEACPPDWK